MNPRICSELSNFTGGECNAENVATIISLTEILVHLTCSLISIMPLCISLWNQNESIEAMYFEVKRHYIISKNNLNISLLQVLDASISDNNVVPDKVETSLRLSFWIVYIECLMCTDAITFEYSLNSHALYKSWSNMNLVHIF